MSNFNTKFNNILQQENLLTEDDNSSWANLRTKVTELIDSIKNAESFETAITKAKQLVDNTPAVTKYVKVIEDDKFYEFAAKKMNEDGISKYEKTTDFSKLEYQYKHLSSWIQEYLKKPENEHLIAESITITIIAWIIGILLALALFWFLLTKIYETCKKIGGAVHDIFSGKAQQKSQADKVKENIEQQNYLNAQKQENQNLLFANCQLLK